MAKQDDNLEEEMKDETAEAAAEAETPVETPDKPIEEMAPEELQNKCAEYEQGWRRALADYENLKRDMSARAEESRRAIKASLARELLPVVDNFAQAVKFQPDMSDASDDIKKKIDPWMQGILYIEKQFEEAMSQMGVEPIPTDGQFDPMWHEAASERQEDDKEDGAILEVMIPGWKLGDIVLRPAKVVVNKKE